jgi:hypothetical protein
LSAILHENLPASDPLAQSRGSIRLSLKSRRAQQQKLLRQYLSGPSRFIRADPDAGPAMRSTATTGLRLQNWHKLWHSQRTNICSLFIWQTFLYRSRVHGAKDSSPVLRGDKISTVRRLCDTKSLKENLHSVPYIMEPHCSLEFYWNILPTKFMYYY